MTKVGLLRNQVHCSMHGQVYVCCRWLER